MLLVIIWYFFDNYFWPRPRTHSPGLGVEALASFNITGTKYQARKAVQHGLTFHNYQCYI